MIFMSKNSVATIYDVAGAARVSMATVSRVLNNQDKVNTATREKVLKIVNELGYVPNPIARDLATKKATTISVVVSDMTRTFVPQTINGILNIADEFNYSIKISLISSKKAFKDLISTMIAEKVGGVIFINDNFGISEVNLIKEIFDKYNTPYVVIDKQYEEDSAFNVGVEAMKSIIKY